ncbi:MAG: energy transducer TonB [bacterium]
MTTGALPHDALLPRPPGGTALGALLALTTHAVLIAALAWATQWRTTTPQVVTAELWASLPELAAPAPAPAAEAAAMAPPVQPPAPAPAQEPAAEPPAPQPDITTAKAAAECAAARREQADRARAAREQAAREQAVRERRERRERQREAEAAREQARQQQLRRMLAQAGAGAGAPQVAASAAGSAIDAPPSTAYVARLADLIRSQTVFSGDVPGNPAAEVEVRAAASGTIIARRLLRSSGHPPWDEAVLRAIDRVGTLPRDTDGRVPSTLIVAFRPKE